MNVMELRVILTPEGNYVRAHTVKVTPLTLEDVRNMPTIESGLFEDLKYKDENVRVLLSHNGHAQIEIFEKRRWKLVQTLHDLDSSPAPGVEAKSTETQRKEPTTLGAH